MAVTQFHYQGQRSIAMCIVDNTDIAATGWGREISVNLSDQLIFKISSKCYDIYIDSNEDALLQTLASKEEYTHAVMIASGTSLKLNENLFSAVEKLCKTEFAIAGHIIDRNDAYYELHHQFYIVNLKNYRQIGFPALGKASNELHTQIEPIRSIENVHDDYVPLWIKQGSIPKQYQKKMHGWQILSRALEHNMTVIDIGQNIRDVKKYFYYEHDHVFVKELPELYHHMFFGANFVPAWNSDAIPETINFQGPVEHYVTVGTGYNWIKNLETLGYTKDTVVTFTDVNPNCLAFMKAMMEDWDGNDYGTFYKDFIVPLLPVGPVQIPERYYSSAQLQWTDFKSKFNDWDTVWSKIKQLKYQYIAVNYTALYNLDFIDVTKHTFFNVSDLFNYTPFAFTASLKYRIACENRLIMQVKNKNPNITLMFTARAADGFRTNAIQFLGPAKDFELTDINSLKTPPWHIADWFSPRMLG